MILCCMKKHHIVMCIAVFILYTWMGEVNKKNISAKKPCLERNRVTEFSQHNVMLYNM